KVDVTEIVHADIDRHLLSLARAWPVFDCRAAALHAILMESTWIPIGAYIPSRRATDSENSTNSLGADSSTPTVDGRKSRATGCGRAKGSGWGRYCCPASLRSRKPLTVQGPGEAQALKPADTNQLVVPVEPGGL